MGEPVVRRPSSETGTRNGVKQKTEADPSSIMAENSHLISKMPERETGLPNTYKRAGWVHGSRPAALVLLALLAWGGIEYYRPLRASFLVNQLRDAETTQVPALVLQLDGYRRWANPRLKELVQSADDDSRVKLHGSLALLPVDPSQLPFLEKRLLVASPTDLGVIRAALWPHRETLIPKLWSVLDAAQPGNVSLLPTASALADYDATSNRWESLRGKVAQALVSLNPILLGPWLDALRPVRGKFNVPLGEIFRDKNRPESVHLLATDILTDYASDDPNLIANFLMDADPKGYADFFRIAQRQESKTLPLFQDEIAKRPEYSWNDPPLDPSWTRPDATLTGKIESAQGMLAERFAFCQTMPLDEFLTTAEGLRPSGYRPTRFRPYAEGKSLGVAAVWTRDGRPCRLAHDQSADEIRQTDERNGNEGYLPVDVAGYLATGGDEGKPTSRFAALWRREPDQMTMPACSWRHRSPNSRRSRNNSRTPGLSP